jgi:hypothetical protein
LNPAFNCDPLPVESPSAPDASAMTVLRVVNFASLIYPGDALRKVGQSGQQQSDNHENLVQNIYDNARRQAY